MGTRANFSRKLGIKVVSGEQFGISCKGTVKETREYGRFLKSFLGKREYRPSECLIGVFFASPAAEMSNVCSNDYC